MSLTGKQLSLTLFDEHMSNLVATKADEVAVKPDMLQGDELNALISTRVYITLNKTQRGTLTKLFGSYFPLVIFKRMKTQVVPPTDQTADNLTYISPRTAPGRG